MGAGLITYAAAIVLAQAAPVPDDPPWEYTRWGMTMDEVIAASGGKAWRTHNWASPLHTETTFLGRTFDVAFGFRGGEFGTLSRVSLTSRTRVDCDPIAQAMGRSDGSEVPMIMPKTGQHVLVSINDRGCEIDFHETPVR